VRVKVPPYYLIQDKSVKSKGGERERETETSGMMNKGDGMEEARKGYICVDHAPKTSF
jgi:hypothetical protein